MLILLPPSEGKYAPRRGRPLDLGSLSFPALEPARAEVLDALVSLCTADSPEGREKAAGVLGLGKTLLAEVERNARLCDEPTARADRVYTGVLYEALDFAGLTPSARRRAASRVAVTSALFGLLRPVDAIPAYRLSGSVSLPGVGSLAGFWGRRLDGAVREALGSGLLVDLRSSTYTPFWRPGRDLAHRVVTVRVLHESDGRRSVVSHFNKATKGRLVRDLLEDGADPRTTDGFADLLARLGRHVEVGEPGKNGTPLDVVVTDL